MPYKTGIRLLSVARNPANGFPARPLAEQQAALDRIEQEAQDIATPAEGAEENTEGE